MGAIKKNPPVKLAIGFIFKDTSSLAKAKNILARRFGKIDFESQILTFDHTDYYRKEFGEGLKRQFITFARLILPEALSAIKIITNKIERKFAKGNSRSVNIDPGYLDLSKLVLASTKDFRHRIYLDKGIFAEITLYYQDKTFKPWEWTYPDYRTKEYIDIFNRIREAYSKDLKDLKT